jgi:hypothetical protein
MDVRVPGLVALATVVVVGGCMSTLGIDEFQRLDCVDNVGTCDASTVVDAGDQDAGADAVAFEDSEVFDTQVVDVQPVADAGNDVRTADTGADAACTLACDTTFSNGATCASGSCQYTSCKPGRSDCNTTSPNTNGCECATPACCPGEICQTMHSNGVGQSYYDCTPVGTYGLGQAQAACLAFTGKAAECTGAACTGPGQNVVVCSTGAATCQCWNYTGTIVGHVHPSTTTACSCPSLGDPSWN